MLKIIEHQPLKQYNTFSISALCSHWSTFENDIQLQEIINYCHQNRLQWMVIGGGSNIIFSHNFDGMIIHPVSKNIIRDQNLVIADAGIVWDDFVAWSIENSLSGVENLSHIPGSVGAAPVQNVGAYGAEACQTIQWVEYFDTQEMKIIRIQNQECRFGYRDSIFKHELKTRAIVVRVAFNLHSTHTFNVEYGDVKAELEKLGGISLQNIRQAIINIRSAKLPDPKEIGSAGSFFKNPIVDPRKAEELKKQYPTIHCYATEKGTKIPAGWLIDQAGWKGYRKNDAGVHPRQALVLVNYGTATATEILELAEEITKDIEQKFGIELQKEVNVW